MIKNILIAALFIPLPVVAQQVNEYDVCTRYRESYTPGYYDSYGNYISGSVNTQEYTVPCNRRVQVYSQPQPIQRHERQVYCDPTRSILGAGLGGGLGAIFNNRNTRRYTIPIGAALGGIAFGCN